MNKAQRRSYRYGLSVAKEHFTNGGRSSVTVSQIETLPMCKGKLLVTLWLSHPEHKNNLLDEAYFITLGIRGKVSVKTLGMSFGSKARKLT